MDSTAKDVISNAINGVAEQFGDPNTISKVAAIFIESQACSLCLLRFLRVRVGAVYLVHPPCDIYRILGLDPVGASSAGPKPCSLCLGILSMTLVEHVVCKFKEQEFDTVSATVSVELPKSLYVRHRSMQVLLKTSSFGLAASDTTELKDVIKFMVGQKLHTELAVHSDADSDMRIEIGFCHPGSDGDHQFLVERQGTSIKTKTFRKRGVYHTTGDSRSAILNDINACSDEEFASLFACPPPPVELPATVGTLSLKRASIYIGGRYLKLQRDISQTPFFVGERRITDLSVADVVGEPIKALVRCDSYNLVGSGREDADVRMLGEGRPFYLECTNPRTARIKPEQLLAIENQLLQERSPVQVRRLQMIRPEDTSIIKEGEEHKTKQYCALVWMSSSLSEDAIARINDIGKAGILLQQKTPIRVLHRRAPLARAKRLLSLELTPLSGRFYKLRVESEAGTYIKEFIHGDLGRTVPSLADMAGVTADIIELDVENVSLDFPPTAVAASGNEN